MSNQLTIGERPNKKNIESLDLIRKVNLLRLWHENNVILKIHFLFDSFLLKEENLAFGFDEEEKMLQ